MGAVSPSDRRVGIKHEINLCFILNGSMEEPRPIIRKLSRDNTFDQSTALHFPTFDDALLPILFLFLLPFFLRRFFCCRSPNRIWLVSFVHHLFKTMDNVGVIGRDVVRLTDIARQIIELRTSDDHRHAYRLPIFPAHRLFGALFVKLPIQIFVLLLFRQDCR